MKKTSIFGAVLVLCASGCSDSSGPEVVSVSGTWTYNASNIVSSGISCAISGVTATLNQSGNTFTGTTTGGTLACSAFGLPAQTSQLPNDVVANGTINGNAVTFDIGTSDIHHSGTLSGNSISGQVTLRVQLSGTPVTLVGQFAAVKR